MKNTLSKSDEEAKQREKDLERQIIEEVKVLNKLDCNAELIAEFEMASLTDFERQIKQ